VGAPYQVGGVWYVPREQPNYDAVGVASWYGDEFHQKATANGEMFDMNAVTAAHTTLPLPSMVEVTNLENGRKLMVRVNDRGPFVGDRIIDLSRAAARELGYERAGLAKVRVRYVGPAPLPGEGSLRYAQNRAGEDKAVRYGQAAPLATRLARAPAAGVPAAVAPKPPVQKAPTEAAPIELAEAMPAPPPTPIQAQSLPPLTGAAISSDPIPPAPTVVAASAPLASHAPLLRIQAGAFSSEANAQRAVTQLAPAGAASIEPIQREGATLYRVVLPAPPDEAAAYQLRDRVAEIGFADARVIQTF
jgi:rare lipoprotein A